MAAGRGIGAFEKAVGNAGARSGCVCYAVTASHFGTVKLNDRSVQSSEQRDCCQILRDVSCSRESRDRIDYERERERE